MALAAHTIAAEGYRLFPQPAPETDPLIRKAIHVIEHHPDTMGKIAKLYAFLRNHADSHSAPWARETLLESLLEAGEYDKAITVGKQIIAIQPLDLFTAARILEAEKQRSGSAVVQYEQALIDTARRLLDSPEPSVASPQWEAQKEWARRLIDTDHRSEEARLYKAVLDSSGKARLDACVEILRRFPRTSFRKQILNLQFEAALTLTDSSVTLSAAEALLEEDPNHSGALLTAAQTYLNKRTALAKVENYAHRFLAAPHPPEQHGTHLGSAHLLFGSLYITRQDFTLADQHLRLARPHLTWPRLAATLFFLGYANYYLERYPVAMQFFEECAAIPGDYQQQALDNIANMKQRGRTK